VEASPGTLMSVPASEAAAEGVSVMKGECERGGGRDEKGKAHRSRIEVEDAHDARTSKQGAGRGPTSRAPGAWASPHPLPRAGPGAAGAGRAEARPSAADGWSSVQRGGLLAEEPAADAAEKRLRK
jgi:hypothetical protein